MVVRMDDDREPVEGQSTLLELQPEPSRELELLGVNRSGTHAEIRRTREESRENGAGARRVPSKRNVAIAGTEPLRKSRADAIENLH